MTIKDFDPNAESFNKNNLYGLPHSPETASLIIIPVPWEVTVSYRGGTANGPARVLQASHQIDLFHSSHPELWKKGISMIPFPDDLKTMNNKLCAMVKSFSNQKKGNYDTIIANAINNGSEELNKWVKHNSLSWLNKGKIVGTLGGEHSTCFGLINALSEIHKDISILQIDAHADLRCNYQGLKYSHASIMHNIIQIPQIKNLVLAGIRDFCEEEANIIQNKKNIVSFSDQRIKRALYEGKTWENISNKIIKHLGQKVYLSFDVDGLNPSLCPETGTPVPGGFEFEQALFLIESVINSGKEIIGFDISETGDGEWDANVSARILWRLAGMVL